MKCNAPDAWSAGSIAQPYLLIGGTDLMVVGVGMFPVVIVLGMRLAILIPVVIVAPRVPVMLVIPIAILIGDTDISKIQ